MTASEGTQRSVSALLKLKRKTEVMLGTASLQVTAMTGGGCPLPRRRSTRCSRAAVQDVVVGHRAPVLQLPACVDETLLVRGNALPVLG